VISDKPSGSAVFAAVFSSRGPGGSLASRKEEELGNVSLRERLFNEFQPAIGIQTACVVIIRQPRSAAFFEHDVSIDETNRPSGHMVPSRSGIHDAVHHEGMFVAGDAKRTSAMFDGHGPAQHAEIPKTVPYAHKGRSGRYGLCFTVMMVPVGRHGMHLC
jgi:hypothetical protein